MRVQDVNPVTFGVLFKILNVTLMGRVSASVGFSLVWSAGKDYKLEVFLDY